MTHWKFHGGNLIAAAALVLSSCPVYADQAGSAPDTPSTEAVRQVVGGARPDSLPAETGTLDITEKMGNLLTTAKETGEVMKLYADWKSGRADAVADIFTLAKNGNARAQNLAGYMLDNGEGVKQDSKAAAAYFKHAADQLPLAKYNLAVLTFYGRGVKKDERTAMALFKDSAIHAGVEQACVQLSLYYLRTKNEAEAYKWANEGANRGNVKAFYILGRILYQRKQYQAAWTWIQKAASASEPNAPAIVSLMYRDGLGTGKNPMMGAAWWLVYTGMSRKQVGNNLASMSSFNLTEDEQRRAINFANNWIANHGRDKRVDYQKTLLQTS